MAPELREADLLAVRDQLGREPTTAFTVVARCTGGHPLVIRNAPRDAAGAPFPTTYWLTCPRATKAVARLESAGAIGELNGRAEDDAGFRAEVEAAHAEAARDRATSLPEAEGWGGVGGTRRGIKCLHAHYANHLAGGDDVVGRWVAERIEPVHDGERPRVAAIDQGTNSCRLLVAEEAADPGAPPTELARDMVITKLGQDVDATGVLAPAALERTGAVLRRYGARARALHARRIVMGATSAVRDAANPDAFAAIARDATGAEPAVIDGEEEAALSFLGGTFGLDPGDGPFALLDIGGGSTEFVTGARPGTAEAAISTEMGSVRLTERHVRHDPPTAADLEAIRADVRERLDEAAAAVPFGEAATFVSVAGTATTLQAIALELERYDPDRIHRTWLAAAQVDATLERLAEMTDPERAALSVMAPGRGEVIVAGAVILQEVLRRFGFDRTLVSETDILDALVFRIVGVR
ncbi:MAG TPA: DUF501 domain-containing protein [Actinomycetota bacterium]|nr:DUF501 domain-containing protein [Actinomycetota bacterium]